MPLSASGQVLIVSPSITKDREFREKLAGNVTSDRELLAVVQAAFVKDSKLFKRKESGGGDVEIVADESRYWSGEELAPGPESFVCGGGSREDLEIRAKVFLQDFDAGSAVHAVDQVLKHIRECFLRTYYILIPQMSIFLLIPYMQVRPTWTAYRSRFPLWPSRASASALKRRSGRRSRNDG